MGKSLQVHLYNAGFRWLYHWFPTNPNKNNSFCHVSVVSVAKISGHHFDQGQAIRPPAHPPISPTQRWPSAIRRDAQIGWADGCVQPRVGEDSPPAEGRWYWRVALLTKNSVSQMCAYNECLLCVLSQNIHNEHFLLSISYNSSSVGKLMTSCPD